MNKHSEVRWEIKAYTAETMPLDRLTKYLTELATLLGKPQQMHLLRVESGSTVPVLRIDESGLPDIKRRSDEIRRGVAPIASMQSYRNINRMLKEDKTGASLVEVDGEKSAEIIPFPGISELPPLLKGVQQHGKVDGRLQRIGGAKAMVPIQLRTLDGSTISGCYAKRDLAKEISGHLFEPVRLWGRGSWSLSATGQWAMDSFHVDSFDKMSDESLLDVVAALRKVKADWVDDPIGSILDEGND
ncbi:hypothetical protein KKP04_12480 [Rhodomicrobium sp. Az07]|uniref:hypothetical protein n=1 Tax=Rhodomicrobium sp. Az07 TaxID=2839034 RepID=UPI001BE5F23C|nr:hypothetical protein [Rhodomicrobium sp. Az07]MBT3071679.1 hypothetical protein [Rhodomicrobium sp. Az07]